MNAKTASVRIAAASGKWQITSIFNNNSKGIYAKMCKSHSDSLENHLPAANIIIVVDFRSPDQCKPKSKEQSRAHKKTRAADLCVYICSCIYSVQRISIFREIM